jgi:hypothetical protein
MSTTSPPPKIACPHCQGLIKTPSLAPGSLVNCPKCGRGFALGGKSEGPEVRGPRPEGGGRKAEDKGQRTEVRSQAAAQPPKPTSAPQPPAAKPNLPRAHSGTRGVVTPPDQPVHGPAQLATADLVPIDAGTAAAATQPAHQPPGKQQPAKPDTIDPLMLGPQPLPKPKVNRDEIAVVCYLCRTRMYAPLSKVGETIKCPDCHTLNEVKAPKAPPEKKPTGPTLDDTPDYGLDDPGDRPAYRPIVAPRGEYAALAEFDPAQRPAGWSHPNQPAGEPTTAVAQQPYADDDEDHVEIKIAAPVERIEIKPEIKPLPPPDPAEDLYDGKYDDGLIGDHVDRSAPEAWKKAPMVIGILGFLFYSSTIPRLIMYVVGLVVALNVAHTAIAYGSSEDPSEKVAAIFFSGLSVVSLGFWVVSFAAVLLSVVQDTANGQDDVTSYPDWNIVDWVVTSAYFPAAAFVAGLPGSIFTVTLISVGLDPVYGAFAAGAPLVISWIALFPLVLFSMLAEGSIMAPYSPATYRSTQQASEGWVFFYMYAILIGIFGSIALALAGLPYLIANAFGCLGLVVLGFLYCRILGRLMWYSSEKMAKQERLEERRRAAAGA